MAMRARQANACCDLLRCSCTCARERPGAPDCARACPIARERLPIDENMHSRADASGRILTLWICLGSARHFDPFVNVAPQQCLLSSIFLYAFLARLV
eukprot:6085695-Pleurochrysis_carterae.AAC.1